MDNITDTLNNYIDNPSYVWVPIVAFVVIILIAGLIGFWNGWKTSLYFFGWNLVGVIAGVLSTSSITGALDNISMLKPFIASIGNVFGLLILFVFMLAVNFLAFLFYFIFRKRLKKSIKENKKAGKSNVSARFIGAGIAIVSASPSAVFLSNTAAVMSPENGFTKFTDALAKAFTGGKYGGTSEARVLIKNLKTITDLASAFDGSDASHLDNEDTKKALQKVLDTDFTKNVDDIYDGLKNSPMGDEIKKADLANVDPTEITRNVPALGLQLSDVKKKELTDSLVNIFKDNSNPEGVAKALVDQLIA